MTPLMEQYWALKHSPEAKGALLFFRMGDFYELFGSDAEEAHALLGITLTSREKSADAPKMAGVPHHSAEGYLERLLNLGRKVAIAEQMEQPEGKGIVRRAIVRVLSPGIRLGLADGTAVYTARWSQSGAFAAVDAGTGDVVVAEAVFGRAVEDILLELNVRHLLLDDEAAVEQIEPSTRQLLCDRSILIEATSPMGRACSPEDLVTELTELLMRSQGVAHAAHLKPARTLREASALVVSPAALQHLDVISHTESKLTVMERLRKTRTAMGGRLFKQWVSAPLTSPAQIAERQATVARIAALALDSLRASLGEIYDLDRLCARISLKLATPKDLCALRASLRTIQNLESVIGKGDSMTLPDSLRGILATLESAFNDEGLFARGYNSTLDHWMDLTERGAEQLLCLETAERLRTEISTLKVKYHRSFGYFFEVSKSQLGKIPSDYVRKQSMVGAERFSNEALDTLAEELGSAEQKRADCERALYGDLLNVLAAELGSLAALSSRVARLDVMASLAVLLGRPGWRFPQIDESHDLCLEDSRHPLLADDGSFVPNTVTLNGTTRALLITGPNMGGKSTLLRQVGLSVILGQMGAPLPATKARWGAMTALHTRIGAHDSLERGQSTFMVEMQELATILSSAHDRSLVLLDEIGRGTSTFDGLSVAWATLEWLCSQTSAKVLCSTHYHELTELALSQPALVNVHVGAEERDGSLRFLYKLIDGPASESFGIHVAKLAGLPRPVIDRAWQILATLESADKKREATQTQKSKGLRVAPPKNDQLSLFRFQT